MSEENIDAVRRIYEGWGKGDFSTGVELYDPQILLIQGPDFPESGTYVGLEGVREYMDTFLDAWERVTIEATELIEGETIRDRATALKVIGVSE